jgi:hypothetical protein
LGCKAEELLRIKENIAPLDMEYCHHSITPVKIVIPRLTVITTEYFDRFMEENNLYDAILPQLSDEKIAQHCLEAKLPEDLVDALRSFLAKVQVPLAVRSSIFLKIATGEYCDRVNFPCAGIYSTKIVPNSHSQLDIRLSRLVEAVKFVYASAFFYKARCYLKGTSYGLKDEKMAVIIQELLGMTHNDRFYPHISGVARSYNVYPFGHAKPEDGVVSLALGLGKTITDGEAVWTYSPQYPEVNAPFNSINEMLRQTKLDFWGVQIKQSAETTPMKYEELETQYLVQLNLKDTAQDNTLGFISSAYDFSKDRIKLGIEFRNSRIIGTVPTFRVDLLPVNQLIKSLLKCCEEIFKSKIEIEFAITFDPSQKEPAQLGLLQVKSLDISKEIIDINKMEASRERILAASDIALGNGAINFLEDVIYIKPETFHLRHTETIAKEIEEFNRQMKTTNHPYLLMGFGRWGTTNPGVGIPVEWKNICCARTIIESHLPNVAVDFSRGANVFHNISTLGVFYFCMKKDEKYPIDWEWLKQQELVRETNYVRHVRLKSPLTVKVDGRKRQGVIYK